MAVAPSADNAMQAVTQQRITAMIASVRGGSAGYRRPLLRGGRPVR